MNYNLEEFKAWLAADPSHRGGIGWETPLMDLTRGSQFSHFVKAALGNAHIPQWSQPSYQPYRQVFLKFKAEVDNRERESK